MNCGISPISGKLEESALVLGFEDSWLEPRTKADPPISRLTPQFQTPQFQEYRKLWEANFERLDTLLDELKARKNKP